MDLSDALGGPSPSQNNQQAGGAVWPGQQPNQPQWPGQQPNQPQWPGQQPNQPQWPGQPSDPAWPGQQPGQPQWPGPHPGQPYQPTWPAQPSQPSSPGWPSPNPGTAPPTAPQRSMAVPYDQTLPNGVFNKMLITINGTIKPNAKMFTVNLAKGKDIALHLNPRFDEHGSKVFVRNTMIANKWGQEERQINVFPFTQGQPFEMKILCTASEYRVAVNKTHVLEYKHRVRDLHSITGLGIYNDVTLSNVVIDRLP